MFDDDDDDDDEIDDNADNWCQFIDHDISQAGGDSCSLCRQKSKVCFGLRLDRVENFHRLKISSPNHGNAGLDPMLP